MSGQVVQFGAKPLPEVQAFKVSRLSAIASRQSDETVQGLYGPGQVVATVGAPNVGKTAFCIDHALSVAAGVEWFGRKVAGGPVVYVAAEAPGSVIMRAQAATRVKFEVTPAFYVAEGTPALGDAQMSGSDLRRVLTTLKEVEANEDGRAVKLVLIDTLASCLGDGDENSDGMIRLVGAAKHIALAAETTVMLIHHPAKAAGDGRSLRGHGSLQAACDVIISISLDDGTGVRTATIVKSRDGATGLQFAYELEPVTLPEPDAFGDPRTTIIVRPTEVKKAKPRPSSRQQEKLLVEIERRYRAGEHSWDEATLRKAGRELGMPRNSPGDAIRGLTRSGYLTGTPSHLTLKFPPEDLS